MSHELANRNWHVKSGDNPTVARSTEHAILATLMDIRTELTRLNVTLSCYRVRDMADAMIELRRIAHNAWKPKRINRKQAARILGRKKRKKARNA